MTLLARAGNDDAGLRRTHSEVKQCAKKCVTEFRCQPVRNPHPYKRLVSIHQDSRFARSDLSALTVHSPFVASYRERVSNQEAISLSEVTN